MRQTNFILVSFFGLGFTVGGEKGEEERKKRKKKKEKNKGMFSCMQSCVFWMSKVIGMDFLWMISSSFFLGLC